MYKYYTGVRSVNSKGAWEKLSSVNKDNYSVVNCAHVSGVIIIYVALLCLYPPIPAAFAYLEQVGILVVFFFIFLNSYEYLQTKYTF